MLITDDTGPIWLAAVMGGATTEVAPGTTTCCSRRRTGTRSWSGAPPAGTSCPARRPSGWSAASTRELPLVALERAVELLGRARRAARPTTRVLDIDHARRRRADPARRRPAQPGVIGVDYSDDRWSAADARSAATVEPAATLLDGHPAELAARPAPTRPTWSRRSPGSRVRRRSPRPAARARPARAHRARQRRRRAVGRALAEAGLCRGAVATRSSRPAVHDAFGLPGDDPRRSAVRLANPLSEEEPELRTTLLPPLLGRCAATSAAASATWRCSRSGGLPPASGGRPRRRCSGVDRGPTEEEWAAADASVPAPAVARRGRARPASCEPAGWWGPGRAAGWADAVQAARSCSRPRASGDRSGRAASRRRGTPAGARSCGRRHGRRARR